MPEKIISGFYSSTEAKRISSRWIFKPKGGSGKCNSMPVERAIQYVSWRRLHSFDKHEDDLALASFTKRAQGGVYCANPSLVEHIGFGKSSTGRKSTYLNSTGGRARNFMLAGTKPEDINWNAWSPEFMRSPFPYFGGKSLATNLIWSRFGKVGNYAEPFAGSLAVLLGRPTEDINGDEVVNDKDGFVANWWRAVSHDPNAVAFWADNPVNEADLHARHTYLVSVREEFLQRLLADPDFYDSRIAGFWAWGMSTSIGDSWCSGKGPWVVRDGKLVDRREEGLSKSGVNRGLPPLCEYGRGVNRKLPALCGYGSGVNRRLPETEGKEEDLCVKRVDWLCKWFNTLAERLRGVKVACGDWERICTVSTLTGGDKKQAAVLLDPPYAGTEYVYSESNNVFNRVLQWCQDNGDNANLKIALCTYDDTLDLPTWDKVRWESRSGYQGDGSREIIYFSPACEQPDETDEPIEG